MTRCYITCGQLIVGRTGSKQDCDEVHCRSYARRAKDCTGHYPRQGPASFLVRFKVAPSLCRCGLGNGCLLIHQVVQA